MGGIGTWQLVILLVVVVLVFGTKKLKNLGGDLGGALKGFKSAMSEEDENKEGDAEETENSQLSESAEGETIDVTAEKVEEK